MDVIIVRLVGRCILAGLYSLKILSSPIIGYGGDVLPIATSVSVVDTNGLIAVNFVGSAYVSMASSPTGFESLYMGQACDITGKCGFKVAGGNSMVNFYQGVATFNVRLFN